MEQDTALQEWSTPILQYSMHNRNPTTGAAPRVLNVPPTGLAKEAPIDTSQMPELELYALILVTGSTGFDGWKSVRRLRPRSAHFPSDGCVLGS